MPNTELQEYRVFGAPGTGKTTALIRSVIKNSEVYGSESIMITSFTRAATREILARIEHEKVKINPDHVRTLHSHGYRVMVANGYSEITQTKRYISLWNSQYQNLQLSADGIDIDDSIESEFGTSGDELLQEYQTLRGKMIPAELWPNRIRQFADRWEKFKDDTVTLDFTDMIEFPLREKLPIPWNPRIGYFDEVQDFTPLELALVRQWGLSMERIIFYGDDDQTIYEFKGATPDAFLFPHIPEDRIWVLPKSYRLPSTIQNAANTIVSSIETRHPKHVTARVDGGVISQFDASMQEPGEMIRLANYARERGETVMILATCGYMIAPIVKAFKDAGMPFHNPYKSRRSDLNPLRRQKDKTSTAERLIAYLRHSEYHFGTEARMYSAKLLSDWVQDLKTEGNLIRGSKKQIESSGKSLLDWGDMAEWFTTDALNGMFYDDGAEWLEANILESKRRVWEYPLRVMRQYGISALTENPSVIIGTIHSVKGAESDHVILLPDVSGKFYESYFTRGGRDSLTRLFYVGMTRARKALHIARPASALVLPILPAIQSVSSPVSMDFHRDDSSGEYFSAYQRYGTPARIAWE